MPAVFRPLAKAELRGAARQLEAALLDGRTRAVESGLVQEFRCEPGGRRYEIRARGQQNSGTPMATTPLPASPQFRTAPGAPSQPAAVVLEPLSETLPDGITFADPQEERRAEPLPEPQAETRPPAVDESPTGERWVTLFCFYPNGRSPNARLKLQGSQSWSVELMLRGLTGTVFVAEPRQQKTDQDGLPRQPWSPDRPADSR
jgi:hypothetical protein